MWWGFGAPKRISQLEDDLRDLRRKIEAIEWEWMEYYHKLKKTMARVVKSEAIIRAKEADAAGEGEGAPTTLVGEVALTGYMTPRQKAIQQQILQRRARGGGNNRALLPGGPE